MDLQCNWRGKLLDVDVHKECCPNRRMVCIQGCGALLVAKEIEAHLTSECSKRPCTCKHCKRPIPFDTMEEHYGVCEERPVSCKFCEKQLTARKLLSAHLEQDCDENCMECQHSSCDFKGRRCEMVQHLVAKHLIQSFRLMVQTGEKVLVVEAENKALREDVILIRAENKTLRQELSECQSSLSDLEGKTNQLMTENQQKDVTITSLKSIVEELQKERDERDLALVKGGNFGDAVESDGPTNVPSLPTKVKLVNQPDLFNALPSQLKALNGPVREQLFSLTGVPDVTRPVGVELSRVKQEVEAVQSTLHKLNDIVQATQDNQTRYGVAIDDIRLRQDILDVKTTNGILIWKIPDIRRRYRDAIDRRTISLYSPPFYTSPHGYRMCIRTYLNGDGIGKGTHISLFFVVMRSEHDNLLPWPFKQSVRFTLINQKNPPASITEAFVPDLKSPSFHKPENDMNIASGFPKFARQGVLNDDNFTLGNMIYIKCQVDLTGLPVQ
ncbi:TNF receptor-associated factor 3 [Geodia barretti]|nr:TNF receptor-associated factor 3 [Geodia barretti]